MIETAFKLFTYHTVTSATQFMKQREPDEERSRLLRVHQHRPSKYNTNSVQCMLHPIHHQNVFVSIIKEFDGSDSGASPDEAISWGKIKIDASPVKVSADATLVFPLIVSQTFYKAFKST